MRHCIVVKTKNSLRKSNGTYRVAYGLLINLDGESYDNDAEDYKISITFFMFWYMLVSFKALFKVFLSNVPTLVGIQY